MGKEVADAGSSKLTQSQRRALKLIALGRPPSKETSGWGNTLRALVARGLVADGTVTDAGRRAINPGLAVRTPMRRRSRKVREQYEETGGRRDIVAQLLAERPVCEVAGATGGRCTREAVDVHEKLMRSAGGSITDIDNLMTVCRACHLHLHSHPVKARELGFLVSKWSGGVE